MIDDLNLQTLSVKDFRSIRGEVVVPLTAPVVLVHGPNGTGKTSLMSALALALAGGEVPGLADPKHLVHHGAPRAEITLGTAQGPKRLAIRPDAREVGEGALGASDASFFAERCYLEQTKLTRLFDVYQQQGIGGTESALTKFVKELLRLDELDALIDGLHTAGDIRRVERELVAFKAQKAAIPELEDRVEKLDRALNGTRMEASNLEASLRNDLAELGLSGVLPDEAGVGQALAHEEDLAEVAHLETLQVRLRGLAKRETELDDSARESAVRKAQGRVSAAQDRHARWQDSHGRGLNLLASELRPDFPRLPSVETASPVAFFEQALDHLEAERRRLGEALAADDQIVVELTELRPAIDGLATRLEMLDRELSQEAETGALGSLARALADLTPHLVGNTCPACSRDFSEVSAEPLSAHVAAEIGRLSAKASQLQAAARARVEAASELQDHRGKADRLEALRLSQERRRHEEGRLGSLGELTARLREHRSGASEGAAVLQELKAAEADLATATASVQAGAYWREERAHLTLQVAAASERFGSADETVGMAAQVETALGRLRERQRVRSRVAQSWERLRQSHQTLRRLLAERTDAEAKRELQSNAVAAVTQRVGDSRALLRRAEAIRRTAIVGVFNSALNRVWADLFVRLAPDEEYVPAFAEPTAVGGLKVRLETRRRDGTPGGTPGEMLSAGNLNTAALTLFLALHLSVRPRVPWILLDDPVQSMDEVHIAQFAALLRTLTQGESQRKVFIAVHERALFDYLALELSPPRPDGGLVTVELRRGQSGEDSTVLPRTRTYEEDTALRVA